MPTPKLPTYPDILAALTANPRLADLALQAAARNAVYATTYALVTDEEQMALYGASAAADRALRDALGLGELYSANARAGKAKHEAEDALARLAGKAA